MAQLVRILEMIRIMLAPLQASALAIRPMLDFFDAGCRDRGELPSGVTNSTNFLRDFLPRSFFCPLRLSSARLSSAWHRVYAPRVYARIGK